MSLFVAWAALIHVTAASLTAASWSLLVEVVQEGRTVDSQKYEPSSSSSTLTFNKAGLSKCSLSQASDEDGLSMRTLTCSLSGEMGRMSVSTAGACTSGVEVAPGILRISPAPHLTYVFLLTCSPRESTRDQQNSEGLIVPTQHSIHKHQNNGGNRL